MFTLVFAIMAEPLHTWLEIHLFYSDTHVQMIPLITLGALNHLPEFRKATFTKQFDYLSLLHNIYMYYLQVVLYNGQLHNAEGY